MTTQPAIEIPAIVIEALDNRDELVAMLMDRIRLDVRRLAALGVGNAQIVQESGLGRRFGRPLGRRTGGANRGE